MTQHHWGDGFDFDTLNKVAEAISKEFEDETNFILLWKEKYGTIRYEGWFKYGAKDYDDEQWNNIEAGKRLWEIIQKHAKANPSIEDELIEDFVIYDEIVGKEMQSKYWRIDDA